MTTPPPPAPHTPSWARPRGGPPEPGSALDEQFAAFIGPRWPRYRRKFAPFFDDARFQPTWNWAAALLSPAWFLYRKLYVPFVFFAVVPGVVFGLLWGDRPLDQTMVSPGATSVSPDLRDFMLIRIGTILSAAILAGGTANYLLFRRAMAAMQLIAPREASPDARLAVLRRVGGVSWRSVAVVLGIMFVLGVLASLPQGAATP